MWRVLAFSRGELGHALTLLNVIVMAHCLKLSLVPYIVCSNSDESGETGPQTKTAVCLCSKCPFHMSQLVYMVVSLE